MRISPRLRSLHAARLRLSCSAFLAEGVLRIRAAVEPGEPAVRRIERSTAPSRFPLSLEKGGD
jgi:hypothetical protein